MKAVLVGGFDSTRLRPLTKDEIRVNARDVISAADRVLEAPSCRSALDFWAPKRNIAW